MPSDQTAAAALANFAGYSLPGNSAAGAPSHLTRLTATGFSGCTIWKVFTADEAIGLKCWPTENTPPHRLPWIHQILQRAVVDGLNFLPAPKHCRTGGTICELAGCTWELMTWLPGEASYRAEPSEQKLQNAFRTLGRFHQVTRNFETQVPPQKVPAMEERLTRFVALERGGLDRIRAAVSSHHISEFDDLAALWLATRDHSPTDYRHQLAAFNQPRPLQPAIRDIWHDHVLFTGDEVTGLIDFGAMRLDTPLVDISRLLGSLARDDAAQRGLALAAYSEISPLTDQDRLLIDLIDETSTWIAGWNWLEWLYVERREFPSLLAVRARLSDLLGRQPKLS